MVDTLYDAHVKLVAKKPPTVEDRGLLGLFGVWLRGQDLNL
ncbi:hypothetical protein [Methylobacterium sp. Leaf99]|nr:hypothetical protein [Methylobacterium sp. Leaf99]